MSRLPSISAESAAIKSGELAEAIYNPDATRRPIPRSYRSHFKQQYMLNSAWNSGGRLAAKYVIESPGVATALIMAGRYIVVALDNSKIFVFREDGKMLRSLFGHVMGVWALTLMGNTLVSGGCDRDVRVWDLKTGNCMQILKGHSSTVRCLQMVDENTAVSGSRDTTVRVWDIRSGQCLQVLEGHNSSVRCLEVVGDICVSGSYDFTAKVWRISDGTLLHTLSGHFSQIYCLAFDGKKIATGSLDASIRVWDVETGSCLGILQGHTSLVGQLQMKNDILVSGGSDGAVRVWELQNYTCVHRFAAHDNSVTSLQFDDSRIVSGGSDGRIRVWDMTTGLHIRDLSGHFDSVWRVAFKDEKVTIAASRNGKIYLELTSFTPSTDDYDMTMPSIEFRTSIHSNSVEKTDVEMSSYDVDPIDSTKPNDSPPASISAKRDPNDMDCS
jgi:F-box and WD-40 domain protein CDC4